MLAFTGIVGAASANSLAVITNAPEISINNDDKGKKKDKKSCCKKDAKACAKEEKKACATVKKGCCKDKASATAKAEKATPATAAETTK